MKGHQIHTDTQDREGFSRLFAVCLAINVPAEEVMFHQHILHSLFQWSLLLLLEMKGRVESSYLRTKSTLHHQRAVPLYILLTKHLLAVLKNACCLRQLTQWTCWHLSVQKWFTVWTYREKWGFAVRRLLIPPHLLRSWWMVINNSNRRLEGSEEYWMGISNLKQGCLMTDIPIKIFTSLFQKDFQKKVPYVWVKIIIMCDSLKSADK